MCCIGCLWSHFSLFGICTYMYIAFKATFAVKFAWPFCQQLYWLNKLFWHISLFSTTMSIIILLQLFLYYRCHHCCISGSFRANSTHGPSANDSISLLLGKEKEVCKRFLFQIYKQVFTMYMYVLILSYRCSVKFENQACPGLPNDVIFDEVCFFLIWPYVLVFGYTCTADLNVPTCM